MTGKKLLATVSSSCLILVLLLTLILSACAKQEVQTPTTSAPTTSGATTPAATKPAATTPAATTPAATKPATTPAAQVIKWKMEQICAPGSMFVKQLYEPWAKAIEQESGGRLVITVHPPQALCPDLDIFKSVSAGMIEVGLSSLGYHKGFMPEAEIAVIPLAMRSYEDLLLVYYHYGLKDFLAEGYAKNGVKLIECQANRGTLLISRKPINRVADFKGMKIRTHTTNAMLVEDLGASSLYIPGAEVYTGLATGTADAATWGSESTLRDFAWYEVAPYLIYPLTIYVMLGYDIYVNPAVFDKLSGDLQAIVTNTASDTYMRKSYHYDVYDSMQAKAQMMAKGTKICTIPTEDYPRLTQAAEKVWSSIAGKGDRAKQAVKIVTDYCRDMGYTSYKVQ
ncbi:MAG: TRAP transporter substrate-binding protein DctP [Dehalococcoidales bacterium]|nr:TRAP transporter substrate-binding protein DctP [Dehalococcoidales bacterium]